MAIRSKVIKRNYNKTPIKYPWAGVWTIDETTEDGPEDRVGLIVLFINEEESIPLYIPQGCVLTVGVGESGGNFSEKYFSEFNGKIEMIFE